ncbi:MAG: transglycosylase SLT domain-containing protein [Nitrospiraceae bacterium]
MQRTNRTSPLDAKDVLARLDKLQPILEQHAGSLWAKRAGLVMGVALRERDPGRAIQHLRMARRDFPVLDEYVRLWTGQALMAAGDTAEGAAMLQSIGEVAPGSLIASRATFEAAEGWYRSGHCDRAIALYPKAFRTDDNEKIKDTTFPAGYLHLADCFQQLQQSADAQDTWRRLWVKYPGAPEARAAYQRLTAPGPTTFKPSAEDRLARAKELHAQALHEEAIEEFRQVFAGPAGLSAGALSEAKSKLGMSYVRVKRYDQAKTVFQELISARASEAGEAVVWLARVYLRLSEGEALLKLPQAYPKVSLTSEQRAMVYILRGVWQEDQNNSVAAAEAYKKAAEQGVTSNHYSEALWKIGWVWYRAGQWKLALAAWEKLAAQPERDTLVPQALYWMARTGERNKDSRANDWYRQVCQRYPVTYYCQLARQRDAGLPLRVTTADPTVDLPGPESLPTDKREEVTRDPAYRRAVELRLLGLDQDAARELTDLTQRHAREQPVVLALSRLLGEAGAHGQALRLARVHFRDELELRGTLSTPALWNVGYPTVFVPTIAAQGMKGVDPYLAAAVIREESQYDGRAVSRVGAIGLMQVMPATASAVAKRFGLADVTRDELFDETTNVRIGVRYLDQLLEQFQGNVHYAVASYNAGPQAVASWVAKHGSRDPDEFVELIPYQETRLYVKRVVRSYREYRRLNDADRSTATDRATAPVAAAAAGGAAPTPVSSSPALAVATE